MNDTRLCTIEQIEQFLEASTQIEFSASGNGRERYDHISVAIGVRVIWFSENHQLASRQARSARQ